MTSTRWKTDGYDCRGRRVSGKRLSYHCRHRPPQFPLSRVCLRTVAQCQGKTLDQAGCVLWAKVSIAADLTYFNVYNQLSLRYGNGSDFAKSLEAAESAQMLCMTSGLTRARGCAAINASGASRDTEKYCQGGL